ncbi:MAG: hypothetical protein QNL04_01585, partial [SAR324 cluster bacterium]|nr:hypothetical protein [SAR324 cluster bacterium]
HQLALLNLICNYQHVKELFISNPNLLYLVIQGEINKGYRSQNNKTCEISWLVEKLGSKQSVIAEELLGLKGKSALKLIKKVLIIEDFSFYSSRQEKLICSMRKALKNKSFNHFERVTSCFLIKFLGQVLETSFETNHSLAKFVKKDFDSTMKELQWVDSSFKDSIKMAKQVGQLNTTKTKLLGFRSKKDLEQIHNSLVDEFNGIKLSQRRAGLEILRYSFDNKQKQIEFNNWNRAWSQGYEPDLPLFPNPPLPRFQGIEPIISPRGLVLEGINMKHCIGSYIEDVFFGSAYIYRLLSPERVTIEILPSETGWKLGQVFSKANGTPKDGTMEIVSEWVLNHGYSRKVKTA